MRVSVGVPLEPLRRLSTLLGAFPVAVLQQNVWPPGDEDDDDDEDEDEEDELARLEVRRGAAGLAAAGRFEEARRPFRPVRRRRGI